MPLYSHWLLPLQLLLPLAFAIGILLPIPLLHKRKGVWSYAAIASVLSLALSIFTAYHLDWSSSKIQFGGSISWIPYLGLNFTYGVSTISMSLILLTTLLLPVVVLGSLIEAKQDMRTFQFWVLILAAALVGTFIARDTIMFYACFEITLLPLYFLISIYGHLHRAKAAKTFLLYTFTGSLLMLAGIVFVAIWGYNNDLYTSTTCTGTLFNLEISQLIKIGRQMPAETQAWVLIAFLCGLGVKTPLWPFHTWLPLAHSEAPTAGSVDLAGLVLKIGPYGLLIIVFPMLPQGVLLVAPWISILAVIGIIAAALTSWVQVDAKKLVAYSSVSHMGLAVLGLFAFDKDGFGATGAVVYMLVHGLSTGGLFMCLGMLYDRYKSRDMDRMSGIAKLMPMWAFFFIFFAVSAVGLPGMPGFVGELLCLLGAFQARYANMPVWLAPTLTIFATTGVVLSAIYILRMVGNLLFGRTTLPHWHDTGEKSINTEHRRDLSLREILTLAPIAILSLWLGLYPRPVIKALETTTITYTQPVNQLLDEAQPITSRSAEDDLPLTTHPQMIR